MAGEFSFDDTVDLLNFDSISHNGIYKCEQCSMLVPYRSLAEHIQLRHKSVNDQIDDGQSTLMLANQNDSNGNSIFRRQAPRPKFLDSDFDTTDTESFVANTKIQRNAAGGGGAPAPANTKMDDRDGRAPVRCADRYQARRLARLQAAREQQQSNKQKKSNGNGASATPQSRRKLPSAMEIFSRTRSQSEIRTQKINGIFAAGIGGNERGNPKKFGPLRRSASAQRAQVVPENFVHCKICSNLMHKDYVEDHIRRKHNIVEPATGAKDTVNATANDTIANDGNSKSSSISSCSSDVSDVADNSGANKSNGKLNEAANDDTANKNNVKASARKGKVTTVEKHKGFRRCQFCEAFMHTDYLVGHLIRKHKTEFIGSSGITWLKYTDEQMNKFIQEGRLSCKNGAFYIKNA